MDSKYFYLVHLVFAYSLKLIAFILAFFLFKLGKQLIEKGVKGEFKFQAKYKGFIADLYSVSPGLLFILLGALIIISALLATREYKYKEMPLQEQKHELKPNIPQDTIYYNK